MDINGIVRTTHNYNFHSHSEFCDGRAPIAEMAESAWRCGMEHYGVSPHSPVPIPSPCNMAAEQTDAYFTEMERVEEIYTGRMNLYTGMEIDFLSPDWGPHIDYFQNLPLEYRIGSVHFVPTQDGIPVDCDGKFERFADNLKRAYEGDLRYVVERYFEQVLTMLERGGFDILGHADKIAANAAGADAEIENQGWYRALIEDVACHAASAGVLVEINTKALADKKRFFPARRWWEIFAAEGCRFVVNSDAHRPERITSGREEAFSELAKIEEEKKKADSACY